MRLCEEIARFVDVFAATQQELLTLLQEKRRVLVAADAVRLAELNASELKLTTRLEALVVWRSRLLEASGALGCRGESLSEVLTELSDPQAVDLRVRLPQLQQLSVALRQEAWIQWVISQRCERHYAEMVDVIARGGQTAPTYEERPASNSNGGAVLDAAV
ncbi:flagellar export chaperone FlgN [Planctellipticum variicoloris]|jgi:hypothetical protein|uniref:flagellar export chaperone FlgN n=1 Tax=Planctellipticum variicoloris TaxID=3064265 RepID=UPI0030141BFC|nr:flagellar protein FlgN [Planctomycetaceae bacterium SH412]